MILSRDGDFHVNRSCIHRTLALWINSQLCGTPASEDVVSILWPRRWIAVDKDLIFCFQRNINAAFGELPSSEGDVPVNITFNSSAIGVGLIIISPFKGRHSIMKVCWRSLIITCWLSPRAAGAIVLCYWMSDVDEDTLDILLSGGDSCGL